MMLPVDYHWDVLVEWLKLGCCFSDRAHLIPPTCRLLLVERSGHCCSTSTLFIKSFFIFDAYVEIAFEIWAVIFILMLLYFHELSLIIFELLSSQLCSY